MAEPSETGVRRIPMKQAAAVALLLLLAGCGSAESDSNAATSKPSSSSTVVGCLQEGRQLTRADIDGDGVPEEVRLEPPSAKDCPYGLVAVTSGSKVILAAQPSDEDPPVTSAYAVAPQGQDEQLVVTKADHPRGGYQLRVYAAGSKELVELVSAGRPLLPFVALDVKEHPWSIDCSADGLVFTEAVAHEPVGVAPAWDIKQTTYTLDGATLTEGPTKEIADNVLPQDLDAKYPDLVKHSAFESCRAA
jgi:hypothetical protein